MRSLDEHAKFVSENCCELEVLSVNRCAETFLEFHALTGGQLRHEGIAHAAQELDFIGLVEDIALACFFKCDSKVVEAAVECGKGCLGVLLDDRLFGFGAGAGHDD